MFCLNYYPNQSYIQQADELKIKYRSTDTTLEAFLQVYKDKSIVIDVSNAFEEIDEKLFSALYEKYSNFKLMVDFNNKDHLNRILATNIPYFFTNFVTTVDELQGLLQYGPTDMYICEELGFSLDKVSELLHSYGIKIRVFPNICQSSFPETVSLKTFFIRPEDIPLYEQYVDVFELMCTQQVQPTLFKVYKRHKWFGEISEIIPSFQGTLNGRRISKLFGQVRIKCGKRCFYRPNSCHICEQLVDLSQVLKEQNLILSI